MPLVNEVVIPTALKDTFNTLLPSQDATALSGVGSDDIAPDAGYQPSTVGDIPIVTDPELAGLAQVEGNRGTAGDGGRDDSEAHQGVDHQRFTCPPRSAFLICPTPCHVLRHVGWSRDTSSAWHTIGS